MTTWDQGRADRVRARALEELRLELDFEVHARQDVLVSPQDDAEAEAEG